MYNLKKILFQNLTPRQKSSLFSHLQALTKKKKEEDTAKILADFLDDEMYYNKISQTHFHFVIENINDEKFLKDIEKFIDGVKYHLDFMEKQQPYIDKQKEFAKEQRKKAQIKKMQNAKPTQKQIKYYKGLVRSHKLKEKSLEGLSRWDLRNIIMEIIEGKNENNKSV